MAQAVKYQITNVEDYLAQERLGDVRHEYMDGYVCVRREVGLDID